jgi:hypothetical protein
MAPLLHYDDMTTETFGGITFTFLALATITTALRLYTRVFVVKNVGLDDYLIVFGTLATYGVAILCYYAALSYLRIYHLSIEAGKFQGPVTPWLLHQWDLGYRYDGIMEFVYVLALPMVKCSILAFYCRIAAISGKQVYIYVFMAVIAIHGIINFGITLAAYDPLKAVWAVVTWDFTHSKQDQFKWRYEPTKIQLTNSSLQFIFDVIILAIPLPMLYKMKLRRSKKVGLIVVYCLSFASVILTVIRLVQCIDFRISDQNGSNDPYQAFISRVMYLFWTSLEISTVILVANLPALYGLWKHTKKSAGTPSSGTPGYFLFSSVANTFRRATGRPAGLSQPVLSELPDVEARGTDESKLGHSGILSSSEKTGSHNVESVDVAGHSSSEK